MAGKTAKAEVPEKIPVVEVTDEQLEAIERFYNEYVTEYTGIGARATAVISGTYHSQGDKHAEGSARVNKLSVTSLTLYGVEIPYPDPYKTSSKHTYYYGIHAGGYRLTLEYHDASGGGFTRLRVEQEEDA